MIFVRGKIEEVVQVDDKTRIKSESFISGSDAEIQTIEINPEDGVSSLMDVSGDAYLDWVYSTNGLKTIKIRITDTLANVEEKDFTIEVKTAAEENLFSKDSDILFYESNLYEYLQEGRDTYIDKHRAAQIDILNELDEAGIWKDDKTRYEASDIVDIQEFKTWSKFLTLKIIFEGIHNDTNDVFLETAGLYESKVTQAKKRATLRLDPNGDGVIESGEFVNLTSGHLRRG